jgi:polar amino acid transport system substrate-binding protein
MTALLFLRRSAFLTGLAVFAGTCCISAAQPRTLATIKAIGTIGLCAHPNSLPFASKTAERPGFQIELGQALAKELGVSLEPDWVLVSYQIPRADCDLMLDMIAARDAPTDFGIKLSKPYYRSGVALAVRKGSAVTSFRDLNAHTKLGVQTGSVAAMTFDRRHVPISVFGFEEDMLAALAAGEIDAAAVSVTAQYFNKMHPENGITILPPDASEPDLVWDVAVGLLRPDDKLRDAVNAALDHLRADGTIDRIYASYGIVLTAPQ